MYVALRQAQGDVLVAQSDVLVAQIISPLPDPIELVVLTDRVSKFGSKSTLLGEI